MERRDGSAPICPPQEEPNIQSFCGLLSTSFLGKEQQEEMAGKTFHGRNRCVGRRLELPSTLVTYKPGFSEMASISVVCSNPLRRSVHDLRKRQANMPSQLTEIWDDISTSLGDAN